MSFFKFARDLTRVVLMPLFRVKYHNVENACRTWTRTIHPHEGSHSHSLTLIREDIGDTIQLYTIKNIKVKAE